MPPRRKKSGLPQEVQALHIRTARCDEVLSLERAASNLVVVDWSAREYPTQAELEHILALPTTREAPNLRRYSYGLYSYGLYSYGLHSYGLHSYGLHSHGLHSYGLHSYCASGFCEGCHGSELPFPRTTHADLGVIRRLYIGSISAMPR